MGICFHMYGYMFPLIYSLRRKLSSEEAVRLNEGGCRRIEKGASLFKWGLYAVSTFSVLCCVLCSDVRRRIQEKIAQTFGISSSAMYLTKPTFFSRINSTEAKTTHDEYWHPHIDKVSGRLGWVANVSSY